jgi:hypothetical protein
MCWTYMRVYFLQCQMFGFVGNSPTTMRGLIIKANGQRKFSDNIIPKDPWEIVCLPLNLPYETLFMATFGQEKIPENLRQ